MRREDIQKFLDVKPFAPIRIFLSDGKYYDVRHPELMLLARSVMDIGITKRREGQIVDDIVRVSLLHVVRVENIERLARKAS